MTLGIDGAEVIRQCAVSENLFGLALCAHDRFRMLGHRLARAYGTFCPTHYNLIMCRNSNRGLFFVHVSLSRGPFAALPYSDKEGRMDPQSCRHS